MIRKSEGKGIRKRGRGSKEWAEREKSRVRNKGIEKYG